MHFKINQFISIIHNSCLQITPDIFLIITSIIIGTLFSFLGGFYVQKILFFYTHLYFFKTEFFEGLTIV